MHFRSILLIYYFNLLTALNFSSELWSNFTTMQSSSDFPNTTKNSSTNFLRVVCNIVPDLVLFKPNVTHGDFWEEIEAEIHANVFPDSSFNLSIDTQMRHPDCYDAYSKFVDCLKNYRSRTEERTLPSSLMIFGPLCEMPNDYIGEKKLKKYLTKFKPNQHVTILAATSTLLRYSDDQTKYADIKFLLSSATEDSLMIWKILTDFFKWKRFALIVFSSVISDSDNRYCRGLIEKMMDIKISHPEMDVTDYEWPVPDSDSEKTMYNAWLVVANVSRVFFICANKNNLARFLKQIEYDPRSRELKYGVISLDGGGNYKETVTLTLSEVNAENALKYLKFLKSQYQHSEEFDNFWSQKRENEEVNRTEYQTLVLKSLGDIFGDFYCSILHYFRSLKSHTELDIATEHDHFGINLTNSSHTEHYLDESGESINVYDILTYDDKKKSFVPVVNVSWSKEKLDSHFNPVVPILWRNGDKILSDELYICDGIPSTFPCPKTVYEKMTTVQIFGLVFGTLCGLILIIVFSVFIASVLLHTSRRFLMYRYALSQKYLQTTKVKGAGRVQTDLNFGTYKKENVIIVQLPTKLDKKALESRKLLQDVDTLARFVHSRENFLPVLGFVCNGPNDYRLVLKLGSTNTNLQKVLGNVKLTIDLKFSLVRDLMMALNDIHQSRLKYHGDLRTNRCWVDDRFVLRIIFTRLPNLRTLTENFKLVTSHTSKQTKCYANELWKAPELLRNKDVEPSSSSDVYSFGIIMHEIVFQKGSFYVKELQGIKHYHDKRSASTSIQSPRSESVYSSQHSGTVHSSQHSESLHEDESCAEIIIQNVTAGPFRPSMPFVHKAPKFQILEKIMERCWVENSGKRPKMSDILAELQAYMKSENIDVAFNTSKRLKLASKHMFRELLQKQAESIQERDRALKYLTHMMPTSLSYELLTGGTDVEASEFKEVTIYFNDIVEFSSVMQHKMSVEIIEILHDVFQTYDRIVRYYDVVPLHRVGSSLLLASGVPHKNHFHAFEIAQLALQIRYFAKTYKRVKLKLRAGIHSGPVMSGIVGKKIQQYGLFGDTVNTASRMSSHGYPGEIQISQATRNILIQRPAFKLSGPEEKLIKGKNKMITYKLQSYGEYTSTVPLNRRLDDLPAPKSLTDPKQTASMEKTGSQDHISKSPVLHESMPNLTKLASLKEQISELSNPIRINSKKSVSKKSWFGASISKRLFKKQR